MAHRIEETVARGICIGCGACSFATSGAIPVRIGSQGVYLADLSSASSADLRKASKVCPFSDEAPNENMLGAPHVDENARADSYLGPFTSVFAGRVNDDAYLDGSSSGGLTSWLLSQLIERKVIDGVISVGLARGTRDELFEYTVQYGEQSKSERKSKYYATTLGAVLDQVCLSDARYAVVGVPCFIKAVRLLCLDNSALAARITFFVGLVCGHMKSQAFAESMAWQLGVPPEDLDAVDFRMKLEGRPASEYAFAARSSRDARWRLRPNKDLIGANWGHNFFQPEACNFCDDVVGETADISFGDAWLPRFVSNPRGTNVVISRNSALDALLKDACARGEIDLFDLTPEEAIRSQAGGFRHRREGLSLRLADDRSAGLSVPRRRVEPSENVVSVRRARLLRQRRRMAALSHTAFAAARESGDIQDYLAIMRTEIKRYNELANPPIRRIGRAAKSLFRQLVLRMHSSAVLFHSNK